MGVTVAFSVFYTFLIRARIREVKMYYEFISLGCGKCDATPFRCFPTIHNGAYQFLIIYYTIASKLAR